MIVLLSWMALYFKKRYNEQKNKFFNGYFIFFIFLVIIEFVTLIFDISRFLIPDSSFSDYATMRFPEYDSSIHKELYSYANNLVRPMYLLIIIVLLVAVSSQVQPLEYMMNMEHHILSRVLFLDVISVLLIFIEPIRNSYYSVVALTIAIILIIVGLFVNTIINARLAIKTVGEVRKRSILVGLGLYVFLLALGLSSRNGWSGSGDLDVILSGIITLIGVLMYYYGFRVEKVIRNEH